MSFKRTTPSTLSPHPSYPPRVMARASAWTVADPNYNPVQTTRQEEEQQQQQPSAKDVEIWKREGVQLDAKNLLPLNPFGRTGLAGKGVLPKCLSDTHTRTHAPNTNTHHTQDGPNKICNPVITRFDPNSSTSLQIMAVSCPDSVDLSLPEGPAQPQGIPEYLVTFLPAIASSSPQTPKNENSDGGHNNNGGLLVNCGVIYEGWADDSRNTDNAWLVTTCIHFHMADSATFDIHHLPSPKPGDETRWIDVDDSCEDFTHLLPAHRRHVITCLMKNPHMYASTLSLVTTDATSLIALISADFESKISQWSERVKKERESLAQERLQFEKEKQAFKNKSGELRDGTTYLEKVLNETLALKQELQTRLSAVPLDLDAEALKKEWNNIRDHKELLVRTEKALEAALDKLADAQAAMDVTSSN